MASLPSKWSAWIAGGGVWIAALCGLLAALPLVSVLGAIPICFWLLTRNYRNLMVGAGVGIPGGLLTSWQLDAFVPLTSLLLALFGSHLLLRRNGWPNTLAAMIGLCMLGAWTLSTGRHWFLAELVAQLQTWPAALAALDPRLGAFVAEMDLPRQLGPLLGVSSAFLAQINLLAARYLQSAQQRPGGFVQEIAGVLWRLRDWVLWLLVAGVGYLLIGPWANLFLSIGLIVPCAASMHGYGMRGWPGTLVLSAYWTGVAVGLAVCTALPSQAWILTSFFVAILVVDAFVDGRGWRLQRQLMRNFGARADDPGAGAGGAEAKDNGAPPAQAGAEAAKEPA